MAILHPPAAIYVNVKCTDRPCGTICAYGNDLPGGDRPKAVKGYVFHDQPGSLADTPPANAVDGTIPTQGIIATWRFDEIGWVFCDGAEASKQNWLVYWLQDQDDEWARYSSTPVWGRRAAETECDTVVAKCGVVLDVETVV
ncbi:MAG: hypothetical protein WED34_09435 [Planctomycetales bacterium]